MGVSSRAVASVELSQIEKAIGQTPILRGIDLDVADSELVVLVGPSGCGKSTLLRTIAGLEELDAGTIRIGGDDVTRAAPRDRDVAMVFQSYALYPHLDVRDNLRFGLKLRKTDPKEIAARIDDVAQMLGLDGLLDRYPRELSGGQRQRVAMGRAIARRPKLFLFDEPLSNLDAALRADVRVEIKRLHRSLAATILYVTHDQIEAMTLADRLVVLNRGAIEQVGEPLSIYHRPSTRFVAGFIGSPPMNFVEARGDPSGRIRAPGLDLSLDAPDVGALGGAVIAGIRPQDIALDDGGITMKVTDLEPMGFEAYAHGTVGEARFSVRLEAEQIARAQVGCELRLRPRVVHLFDPKTERAIGTAEL